MNATMRFLVWGTQPIGGLLGGWLATTVGLRDALWIAAPARKLRRVGVLLTATRHARPADRTPTRVANQP